MKENRFDVKNEKNLSMLTDYYEFTMSNGFFENGLKDKRVYFDMFFRKIPDKGGFAIMAGLQQLIQYIKELKFTDEDIEYLRSRKQFSDEFLDYLKDFKFTCDLWSVPEGTPIFPNEPIVSVRGPVIEVQLIETMVLLTVNHQSLIATKSNRIVRAAGGRKVLEFGSRRAQGYDGAIYGARAAYIGGVSGTACTIADRDFKVPASGTMAHSWVQLFDTEYEAFATYAKTYPDKCVLLVDTYNVLKSGIPNAIRAFNEEVVSRGHRPMGIRLDSGDMAYLSKKARKMLDEAGFHDCKIIASNSLDEFIIRDLVEDQNAQIDIFGVGERLITSKSEPVFGGVYKLVAVDGDNGERKAKIKISENPEKITNPDFKRLYRLFDRDSGKAVADVMTLREESIGEDVTEYEIFHPVHTWKRKTVKNCIAKELHVQVFKGGELVYESPELEDIKDHCKNGIDSLWEEVKRFENPHRYYVDLSEGLWKKKNELLSAHRNI